MSKIRQLIAIAAIGFVPAVASFTTADATTCIKHPDWPQCVDHASTTTTTTTTISPPVTSSVPPTVPTPPPTTTAVPPSSPPTTGGTAPTPPHIGIQRQLPATGLDPVAALVVIAGTICAGAFFLALARSRQAP